MTRHMMKSFLAAALMLLPASAAHAQDTSGTWTIEFGKWESEGVRTVVVEGADAGELEVTVTGDAVLAILRTPGNNDVVRADTLKGELRDGRIQVRGSRLLFSQTAGGGSTAQGDASPAGESVIEIEAGVTDGTLSGTMRMNLGGMITVAASLTGQRAAPGAGEAQPADPAAPGPRGTHHCCLATPSSTA